ncbi:uncharacterized protein LOC115132113 [Oncorhynchus nerka]|uniref:uncharacterized protein LOC115132113 n=1 Tax=Oncorhynchus nerka TaxID=8023 RepID=UPI0031B88074
MLRVNPRAAALKAMSQRLHRRSYRVAGSISLWHLDGNHKLIRLLLQTRLHLWQHLFLCPLPSSAPLLVASLHLYHFLWPALHHPPRLIVHLHHTLLLMLVMTVNKVFRDADGKGAADEGGPSREFLRLLMSAIHSSAISEGPDWLKCLSCNSQVLYDGVYKQVGRMIAVCLVHGGVELHFSREAIQASVWPTTPCARTERNCRIGLQREVGEGGNTYPLTTEKVYIFKLGASAFLGWDCQWSHSYNSLCYRTESGTGAPSLGLSRLPLKLAPLPVRVVLGGRRHRPTSRYRSLFRLSVGFVLLVSPVCILV